MLTFLDQHKILDFLQFAGPHASTFDSASGSGSGLEMRIRIKLLQKLLPETEIYNYREDFIKY
jgi:hypothetical protein